MTVSFDAYSSNPLTYEHKTHISGATVQKVMEYVNLGEHARPLFHRTLAAHRITWKEGETLAVGTLLKIANAIQNCTSDVPVTTSDSPIGQFTEFLLGKRSSPPAGFLNGNRLQQILIQATPTMLKEFRGELQNALLSAKHVNELAKNAFINNILALIPFTYPEKDDELTVPVKKDSGWVNITYTVDIKISLTPAWFSSPMPAYGLTSKAEAPPLLLFLGTTYPAGEGYAATLLADFTPGMSVGHATSLMGKKKIALWLQGKKDVRVCGVSLGGSLALHAARMHTESIGEVYAFNPAGLYPWNWLGFDQGKMSIKIYNQWNDIVPSMGAFPENADVYRVVGPKKENPAKAHMRAYSGSENVTFAKTTSKHEHSRFSRQFLTGLHFLFSSVIFFLILPFHLIYRVFEVPYRCFKAMFQTLRSWFREPQSDRIPPV